MEDTRAGKRQGGHRKKVLTYTELESLKKQDNESEAIVEQIFAETFL